MPETPSRKILPGHILLGATLVALAMVLLVLFLASQRPWLGVRLGYDASAGGARVEAVYRELSLAPGTVLKNLAAGDRMLEFQPGDFIVEPDGNLPSYAAYRDFLARQQQLYAIQSAPRLRLTETDGTVHRLVPAGQRPLASFPPDFWVSLVVGVFAWLLSVAVWCFRRSDTSTHYLLLSGFATLLFAPLAAIYTTRELALPATLFRWLNDTNFFGGNLYAGCTAALLWYYPRPLGRFPAGPALMLGALLWFLLQQSGLLESMVLGRRLSVFVFLALTLVFATLQWRGTRQDPIARAALQWFLLAWLVGATLFSLVIFVPQFYGVDTGALQGYSFLLFLLIYTGLALGILRYGLFELGQWWTRILNWAVGVLLLISLDLLLMLGLQLSTGLSLSLALLICGFVWLPLRTRLWDRLFGDRREAGADSFRQTVGIALAPDQSLRSARWRELLQRHFEPLNIQPDADIHSLAIDGDGLSLLIPAVCGCEPFRLEYAWHGQRLFGPRDLRQARELLDMLDYIQDSREAYNRGATEERRRIARDLHDDVGAHLLTGLQQQTLPVVQQKIREAMAEIRTLISGLSGERLALEEMISRLRYETGQRLDSAGLELDWPLEDIAAGEIQLPYHRYKNFMSAQREVVSNIIRHSGAGRVSARLTLTDGRLAFTLHDDGGGLPADSDSAGHGLGNIQRRMRDINGEARLESAGPGTCITLSFPLADSV